MTDLAAAAGAALGATRGYVAVTGREWTAAAGLVDAAALHVVAPGAGTRLAVATGVRLGGRAAVVVVDAPVGPPRDGDTLVFTASRSTARAALADGWTVVQPSAPADVARLLQHAARPALVVLSGGDDVGTERADAPDIGAVRHWRTGDVATLVGSGAAVGPLLRLAARLTARGLDAAVLEVAVLTDASHAPLVGGAHLLVGAADAWPDGTLRTVALDGRGDADLVGDVLAAIPAARG